MLCKIDLLPAGVVLRIGSTRISRYGPTRKRGGVRKTAETTAILDDAGFTGAAFRDGVFDGPGHVDPGGWARIALANGNGHFGSAGSPNIAGVELIRQLPVSGQWEYRLQTTEIIYPQVSTVPLPAPSR